MNDFMLFRYFYQFVIDLLIDQFFIFVNFGCFKNQTTDF